MFHRLCFIIILTTLFISCSQKGDSDREVFGVVFGDSLAAGLGASSKDKIISSCLQQRTGLKFKNLGISGETTFETLSRVNEVLKLKPKLVLISSGGNDVLRHLVELKDNFLNKENSSKYPTENTLENLDKMYKTFKAHHIEVYHLGISPPRLLTNIISLFRDDRLEKIEDVATKNNVVFIPDSLNGLWDNPAYMSDELHPNDAGYGIVCDRVLEAMKL